MISDPVKNFETQFPIQRKSVGPTATASSRKIQVPTRYVCTEEQKYRGYQTWAYSFVGGAKGLSALFSQKGGAAHSLGRIHLWGCKGTKHPFFSEGGCGVILWAYSFVGVQRD